MRSLLWSIPVAVVLGAAPASAMCGGMNQQGHSAMQGGTMQEGSGSMMCGRPAQSTQAEDPFGTKQSKPGQQQMGMGGCPCCRGMAMMMQRGGNMQNPQMQQMPQMQMPQMQTPQQDQEDPHKGMDMGPRQ